MDSLIENVDGNDDYEEEKQGVIPLYRISSGTCTGKEKVDNHNEEAHGSLGWIQEGSFEDNEGCR